MSQNYGVFVWRDPEDWNSAVHRLLLDCVTPEIKSMIEVDPSGYFYSNQKDKQETPGLRELVKKFKHIYPLIRMFHACKPENVGDYFSDGFKTLDVNANDKKARELFLSSRFHGITSEDFNVAVKELQRQQRQNKLYFCLDDENLIAFAAHYLIYGSEYLTGIASVLSRKTGTDTLAVLRDIGIPTVFICDIPYALIPKPRFTSLVIETIIRSLNDSYMSGNKKPSIDFTFEFNRLIPNSVIVSHYHPSRINDRLAGGIYESKQLTCPFC